MGEHFCEPTEDQNLWEYWGMVDMVDVRMLGFDVYHIKPSICGMDNP